jgi:flagellar biosynthesis/type III secretory pathway protein FliH
MKLIFKNEKQEKRYKQFLELLQSDKRDEVLLAMHEEAYIQGHKDGYHSGYKTAKESRLREFFEAVYSLPVRGG